MLHINLGFLSEVGFFTSMGKGGNLRKTTGEWYREQKIINPHIHACLKCWTKPNGGHMSEAGEGEGEGGDNTTQLHLQDWELNLHQGESCSVI